MTLTIELPPDVMEDFSRRAEERHVTVNSVIEGILKNAAVSAVPVKRNNGNNADVLRDIVTFSRMQGISGIGFDVVAAKHEGHRL